MEEEHREEKSYLDFEFLTNYFERTIVFAQGQVILNGDTRYVYGKEKELREAFLEQPHVTQLCKNLGYNEVFLTAEEFISKFKSSKR